MSAKHTAGPWDSFGYEVFPVADPETPIAALNLTRRSFEECNANLALFVAAPDLLEALRRAHLITCPTVDPIHHTCGGCSISAVIAKAEGK